MVISNFEEIELKIGDRKLGNNVQIVDMSDLLAEEFENRSVLEGMNSATNIRMSRTNSRFGRGMRLVTSSYLRSYDPERELPE